MSTVTVGSAAPTLPSARGPVSELLLDRLREEPHELPPAPPAGGEDPLGDEDLQLALYVLYELHYRSFEGVAADWEWEPSLIAFRRELERPFESALRSAVPAEEPADVPAQLQAILDEADGPSLSR